MEGKKYVCMCVFLMFLEGVISLCNDGGRYR